MRNLRRKTPLSSPRDGDHSDEQRIWMMAAQKEKERLGRQLTYPEILALARRLGYRKVIDLEAVRCI